MGSYCVSCKKYTDYENLSVRKTIPKWINDFMKLCCLWPKKLATLLKIKKLIVFQTVNLK